MNAYLDARLYIVVPVPTVSDSILDTPVVPEDLLTLFSKLRLRQRQRQTGFLTLRTTRLHPLVINYDRTTPSPHFDPKIAALQTKC